MFFSYTLSQGLDHHWFAFVPGEPVFERMTEELMELLGHSCALGMALFTRKSPTLEASRLRNLPRFDILDWWNLAPAGIAVLGITLSVFLFTDIRLLRVSHGVIAIVAIAAVTALLWYLGRSRASPLLMNVAMLPALVGILAFAAVLPFRPAILVRDDGEATVLENVRAPKRGKIARVELIASVEGSARMRVLLRYVFASVERPVAEWPADAGTTAPLVQWDGIRRLRWRPTDETIRIPRITIERALSAWLLLAAIGRWRFHRSRRGIQHHRVHHHGV